MAYIQHGSAGVHNQKILCEKVGAFSLQVPLQANPQALSSGIAITCPHECREWNSDSVFHSRSTCIKW
jgi:hypothetical protein